ncbi:MAG: hypothetical protein ABI895_00355 [Deltaproteobacteria bacterium]
MDLGASPRGRYPYNVRIFYSQTGVAQKKRAGGVRRPSNRCGDAVSVAEPDDGRALFRLDQPLPDPSLAPLLGEPPPLAGQALGCIVPGCIVPGCIPSLGCIVPGCIPSLSCIVRSAVGAARAGAERDAGGEEETFGACS